MKIIILTCLLMFTFLTYANSNLREKYPYGLLTDDYRVLNEADLLLEIARAEVTPYSIEDDISVYKRWQCYETKRVRFSYSTWRDDYSDFGRGATLCDYSFRVKDDAGISHLYFSRRAKELLDCRELYKEWKKVKRNSKYTCLLGEPANYENKGKAWVWEKTKTKTGCMSYFMGVCDSQKKLKEP